MPAAKISISLSAELNAVLDLLALKTGRAKSSVIEMALRENPLVAKYVEIVRLEELADPSAISGRMARQRAPKPEIVRRA